MATNERAFSAEFRKDLMEVYDKNIIVCLLPDMIRTGKKLFDFFILYDGEFIGVECKIEHGSTFNFGNKVKAHQFESLKKIRSCGGVGIFLIYFSKYKECFIVHANNFTECEYTDSWSYEVFKDCYSAWSFKRCKIGEKTRWDVDSFLSHFGTLSHDS